MIIIHGSLAMGGAETFIVRLAKQRFLEGKQTNILLRSQESRSDSNLMSDARRFANVFSFSDIFSFPGSGLKCFPFHFSLMYPLNSELFGRLLASEHVHATCGFSAMFYFRISHLLNKAAFLTVGVYQSAEFIWGVGSLPYFEKLNRQIFFKALPKENCLFFNESVAAIYKPLMGPDFPKVKVFPLGVIDDNQVFDFTNQECDISTDLNIVSVGRLVPFKTYNLHFLEVILQLKSAGYRVNYHIYGTGPLCHQMELFIQQNGLSDIISLKGPLEYQEFDSVVSGYDLFVGSGTAVVQAASLGVCSIIGIENNPDPTTYGFFSQIKGFSYNEDGLYDKKPLIDFVLFYENLSQSDRSELSIAHKLKAKLFSMSTCSESFDNTGHKRIDAALFISYASSFTRLKYSFSFLITSIICKIKRRSLSDFIRQG